MDLLAAVDSYSPPTNEQLQQARAQGIRLWNGYLSSPHDPGIDPVWSAADFVRIRAELGAVYLAGVAFNGIAYCSGEADPQVCKALGSAWHVLIALDVERSIRGLGTWTQPWIDAAGSGVYGNAPVQGVRALFHLIAAWVGDDPAVDWPGNVRRPPGPCGWQWAGQVPMLGTAVDRNVFDASFATPPAPPVPPAPPAGDTEMWMYQALDNTIYLMDGGRRIAFQKVVDVDVYLAEGVKLYLAGRFTPEWNATILAKYPPA